MFFEQWREAKKFAYDSVSEIGAEESFLFVYQKDVMVQKCKKVNISSRVRTPSIQSIAVLRVDGNFYDSYQDAMYYMYDVVRIGGIMIFDDVMSHPPVNRF